MNSFIRALANPDSELNARNFLTKLEPLSLLISPQIHGSVET